MPSKNYGWHKLWVLNMPYMTATHDSGFTVRYIRTDAAVIVEPINMRETAAALEVKHGHNASAMCYRLKKEAAMLWDHAIERQARVQAAIARDARKAARAAQQRGVAP